MKKIDTDGSFAAESVLIRVIPAFAEAATRRQAWLKKNYILGVVAQFYFVAYS